ncbi:MAG TPA: prolipoprotein diacylglyceryl transferase [Planctomycetota bacterium]|nr:prolipoprotein diacylglyceryl transferase [Planctomycetota bacterium]HRR80485.1 prolipoprotein diacylglyceryl transferase [Planctomycetota bacterium]HRT97827.1 prolipoprotein diacylglyceryl transferase [Planctomycetota bacterium]
MHPTLIFPFIHSYGVMLAVGFYAAWWLGARRAKAEGVHPDVIGNLVLLSILAGVVGSRILWFALYRDPKDSWWVLIEVWKGGLVFYGGLIAAAVADYVYLRLTRQDVWRIADAAAPAIALGQAFGRLGCFLNGCCFGGVCSTSFPLQVRFPAVLNEDGAPVGSAPFLDHVRQYGLADNAGASLPVHPTQLYEAASLFMIAALIVVATPYKRRQGELFGLVCVLNAASRLGVEFVRRDTESVLLGLNPGQVGALAILGVGIGIILWCRLRGERAACSPE